MAGRTFARLKSEKTTEELNRFCRKLAEEYARTHATCASTYFTTEYDITVSCYNSVKDYAVTHFLVSDKTVERMRQKAKENQGAHCYRAGASTDKHYYALMRKRRKFVYDLAQEYALSTEVPVEELLEKYGRDSQGYFFIIREAMIGDYGITTEVVKKIQIRMILDATDELECCRISGSFSEIWRRRSSAKSHL